MNQPQEDNAPQFPTADVRPATNVLTRSVSRLWVITLACLAIAVGLVWYSHESPGPTVTIRFPDGHGLKPGDAIRHRGIDVGRVEQVVLGDDLNSVIATATLDAAAAGLACEGCRFWIVRPQVDFSGVRGLETAVGSKYIAVLPAESAQSASQTEFEGLAQQPPESLGEEGFELVLRGDDRFGVHPGTPITWRGVQVGQVISSDLSPDAMHVDTRIRIKKRHQRLVSSSSKFWVTSGVHWGFGMTGVEVSTGTLDTIARGGIAFITPAGDGISRPVLPGDMFTLYDEPRDDWLDEAIALNLIEQPALPVSSVVSTWEQKYFGITRERTSRGSALVYSAAEGPALLLPADLVKVPEGATESTFAVAWMRDADDRVALKPADVSDAVGPPLVSISLASISPSPTGVIPTDRFRRPSAPEDCFAVRRARHEEDENAVIIAALGKHELKADDTGWLVAEARLSRELWHGAAVLSAGDEQIIGILIIDADGTRVAPVRDGLGE